MADHVLDIIGRPAAGGVGMAAMAEGVERHWQTGCRRRLIDRPVAPLARRLPSAAEHQHLGKVGIAGVAFDFGDRGRGVLVGHDDRGLQPRIFTGPFLDLPLVHRMGQRARQVGVHRPLAGRGQRIEDPEFDIVRVQMLPGHEPEVAAGPAAAGREGIPSRRHRLRLRIGRTPFIGLTVQHPEGLHMFLPALRQPGIQRLHAIDPRMDIAIGDHQTVGRGHMGAGTVQHIDVHDANSLLLCALPPCDSRRRGNALSGLSIVILRTSSAEKPSGITSCPSNCQCG